MFAAVALVSLPRGRGAHGRGSERASATSTFGVPAYCSPSASRSAVLVRAAAATAAAAAACAKSTPNLRRGRTARSRRAVVPRGRIAQRGRIEPRDVPLIELRSAWCACARGPLQPRLSCAWTGCVITTATAPPAPSSHHHTRQLTTAVTVALTRTCACRVRARVWAHRHLPPCCSSLMLPLLLSSHLRVSVLERWHVRWSWREVRSRETPNMHTYVLASYMDDRR